MSVKTYRKKPCIVQAIQYTEDTLEEIRAFVPRKHLVEERHRIFIETPEGGMEVRLRDFVIRGIKGEYYPCKPDIFLESYDEVPEPIQTLAR
jgi:hypothetical protein